MTGPDWIDRVSSAVAAAGRGHGLLTALALVGTALAVFLAKIALGRGELLRGGMPSGHSAVAFSLATAAAFVTRDGLVALICACLALLVGHSRLRSRIHTPLEVTAGALLGVCITILIFRALR